MSAPTLPDRLRGLGVELAECARLLAEDGVPPDVILEVARDGIADAVARHARSGR